MAECRDTDRAEKLTSTPEIAIPDVLEALGRQLELTVWVQPAIPRPLQPMQRDPGPASLAGRLLESYPPLFNVVDQAEYPWLVAQSKDALSSWLQQQRQTGLGALVLANGLSLPQALHAAALANDLPVLASPRSCEQVISTLRVYLSRQFAPKLIMHGVFLEVGGCGILIRGASNIGKSELALDLINRGHRLIADDAPEIMRLGPNYLEGSCPELLRGFLEVRGLGVLNIPAMFGNNAVRQSKQLVLIIDLTPAGQLASDPEQRLWGITEQRTILGVSVDAVVLPICPGSQLAVLVEAAVRNHQLRVHGYNAAVDFAARQQRLLADLQPCD